MPDQWYLERFGGAGPAAIGLNESLVLVELIQPPISLSVNLVIRFMTKLFPRCVELFQPPFGFRLAVLSILWSCSSRISRISAEWKVRVTEIPAVLRLCHAELLREGGNQLLRKVDEAALTPPVPEAHYCVPEDAGI